MYSFVLIFACSICLGSAVWPQPVDISPSSGQYYSLQKSSFSFVIEGGVQIQVLQTAFARYSSLIFSSTCSAESSADAALQSLQVQVISTSYNLTPGVDESYTLNVTAPNALLAATTVWGALRGLETFSQLVQVTSPCQYQVPAGIAVSDYPRFTHRGLLIDSSRHYLPVATVLRAIDAMVYSKLNVLHWHLVDAVAFPVESTTFPELSQGAYTPQLVYNAEDIAGVVAYAYARGVRVVPEFDTPGHAYSWGIGYPNITAKCPSWSANVNNVPLNPAVGFTFEVVQGFLGEMAQLFPDAYLHTGGDEVVYQCFAEDPTIQAWMKQRGYTSFDQLMQYYESALWKFLDGQNKTVVAWEEVFNAYNLNVPSNVIIEVWQDEQTLLSVAQASIQGILAYGWYLNQLQMTWQNFYQNEPFQSNDWTPKLESYILGGEICAWGETLNAFNFDQRLWPRTAAAAERLWSPQSVTDINSATIRLTEHICLLNQRGIAAEPIGPGHC